MRSNALSSCLNCWGKLAFLSIVKGLLFPLVKPVRVICSSSLDTAAARISPEDLGGSFSVWFLVSVSMAKDSSSSSSSVSNVFNSACSLNKTSVNCSLRSVSSSVRSWAALSLWAILATSFSCPFFLAAARICWALFCPTTAAKIASCALKPARLSPLSSCPSVAAAALKSAVLSRKLFLSRRSS